MIHSRLSISPFGASGLVAAVLLLTPSLKAEVLLDFVPGPEDTGGMIMPMVYLDPGSQSVTVTLHSADPIVMYRLQEFVVNESRPFEDAFFDPSLSGEAWYTLLDPTEQHLPFSTQLGFMFGSGNAASLPVGSLVYIQATAVTPGLKGYDFGNHHEVYEEGNPLSLLQVFGQGSAFDDLVPWGDAGGIQMWHPLFVADALGDYSATFEIYVGDGAGNRLAGWSSDLVTIQWSAVPEPSTWVLAGAGMIALAGLRRRRNAEGL